LIVNPNGFKMLFWRARFLYTFYQPKLLSKAHCDY
jgi:hypothetical protein